MLNLILEYNRKLWKKKFTHDAFIHSIFMKKISSNPNRYTCRCCILSQFEAAARQVLSSGGEGSNHHCYDQCAWISMRNTGRQHGLVASCNPWSCRNLQKECV